jgi:flagellar hook assembly protein FlgD
VRVLVDGLTDAGEHQVVWDGKNQHGQTVGSGIYFCRLRAGNHSETVKMVLLK